MSRFRILGQHSASQSISIECHVPGVFCGLPSLVSSRFSRRSRRQGSFCSRLALPLLGTAPTLALGFGQLRMPDLVLQLDSGGRRLPVLCPELRTDDSQQDGDGIAEIATDDTAPHRATSVFSMFRKRCCSGGSQYGSGQERLNVEATLSIVRLSILHRTWCRHRMAVIESPEPQPST